LKDWLPVLLGFHKCNNKYWAKSLFSSDPSVPAENEIDGVAALYPSNPDIKDVRQVVVKLDSMERSLKLVHNLDFPAQKDTPW